jgi:hypothetical protein
MVMMFEALVFPLVVNGTSQLVPFEVLALTV